MQQARDKRFRFLSIQTCRTDNNAGSFRLNLKILMEVLQWCSLRTASLNLRERVCLLGKVALDLKPRGRAFCWRSEG